MRNVEKWEWCGELLGLQTDLCQSLNLNESVIKSVTKSYIQSSFYAKKIQLFGELM